jgi:putative endonuclease
MFAVYVLHSPTFDKIFLGFTSNLEQRLLSHNHISTKGYTKRYRPWTVVYTEKLESKSEALKREKQLKSSRGRNFIRKEILK